MDTNFSLRPATLEDLDAVVRLEQQGSVDPWTPEQFQAELVKPYSSFLLLTDDETDSKIAGFIVFWLMFDECQILNLVIDPPLRRQGLAQLVVRKSISMASRQGIQKVVLEVRKSNSAAIQLYQGIGFLITHIRKAYYRNGEDAYQMLLSLKPEEWIQF